MRRSSRNCVDKLQHGKKDLNSASKSVTFEGEINLNIHLQWKVLDERRKRVSLDTFQVF